MLASNNNRSADRAIIRAMKGVGVTLYHTDASREATQLSKIDRDYQKKISAIAGVGSKTKHQAFFITQNNPKQYDKDDFVEIIKKMQKKQNNRFVSANALYNAFQNNEHLCFGPKYGSMIHVNES